MIFVIGATGTIGKELVAQLIQEGEKVRILTRYLKRQPNLEKRSNLSSATSTIQNT